MVFFRIWNGEIYIISPITRTGSLHELGGGVWSRPASGFMTRWRLVPTEELVSYLQEAI